MSVILRIPLKNKTSPVSMRTIPLLPSFVKVICVMFKKTFVNNVHWMKNWMFATVKTKNQIQPKQAAAQTWHQLQ